MLKRVMVLASVGLAVLTLGTGCSNKTAAQRDSLANQNKTLAEQLEAEKQARLAAEARANAATTSATTPPADATPAAPTMDEGPVATGMTGTTGGGSTSLGNGVETHKNKFGQSVIQISGDVLFDSGKATLKPSAKKSLDSVASAIKSKYAGQMLRVEGHTDPNPVKNSSWDDNYDLGHARARAVLLYLKSKGIPEKNMYTASFAATQLKSTKNYALDRRVDIVVTNNGK